MEQQHYILRIYETAYVQEKLHRETTQLRKKLDGLQTKVGECARLQVQCNLLQANLKAEVEKRETAEERCRLWEENFQTAIAAGSGTVRVPLSRWRNDYKMSGDGRTKNLESPKSVR